MPTLGELISSFAQGRGAPLCSLLPPGQHGGFVLVLTFPASAAGRTQPPFMGIFSHATAQGEGLQELLRA